MIDHEQWELDAMKTTVALSPSRDDEVWDTREILMSLVEMGAGACGANVTVQEGEKGHCDLGAMDSFIVNLNGRRVRLVIKEMMG